jgi:MYXO-CTERM domain-containing protein
MPTATAAAFINLTGGPYPEAGALTTGGAQPWFDSPSVVHAFGGVPNAQQQASFTQSVLQDVQHTFQISGMNPTLTTDPNVPAFHTLSVVSGTSYGANPGAIGITDVGANGFSFIDKLSYASNPTDLAWAVAHNIAHELMHAFGIGYHPDSGNYVDAGTASWSLLTDPNAQFGPAATQLLLASQYGTLSSSPVAGLGAEMLNPKATKIEGDEVLPQPVPEPATMAIWGLAALGSLVLLRRRDLQRVN